MNREELARAIYDVAHLTGTFLLRSGITSHEYFDKYQFESDPRLLDAIARELVSLVPADVEILAGLELGGVPIATMMAQHSGKPAIFVRKKAKEYGTSKLAEGPSFEGKRVLIVEDVVTSGGQIILSAADLRGLGAVLVGAVCVIDREAGGAQKLEEHDIDLKPLFTMSELEAAAGEARA
ncbi:MAG: orotate phosphoribosyltransferase [Planctomycetota bacterium]